MSENTLFNEERNPDFFGDGLPWMTKLFSTEDVKYKISKLAGKVLTLIDASITEPIQRKALKDRIKQDFYQLQNDLYSDNEYMKLLVAYNDDLSHSLIEPPNHAPELK